MQRVAVLSVSLALACGDGTGGDADGATGGSNDGSAGAGPSGSPSSGAGPTSSMPTTADSGTDGGSTASSTETGSMGDPTCIECPGEPCTRDCLPPLGAEGPELPPPYSMGRCPDLVAGTNSGFGFNGRDLELFVPSATNGPYAVVFAWHGAGGNSMQFSNTFGDHYDAGGYILVVPNGGGLYDSQWHVEETPGVEGPPPQSDLNFFDDVLTCLWEQYPIDLRRVHTIGFSVGGRFSAYLMGHRSNRIGSFAAWSGGNITPQGIIVVPAPQHPIPGLLYHGGPGDMPACCGFDATLGLASAMAAQEQFTIVCDHGNGHSIPNSLDNVLDYYLAHPFEPGNTASWSGVGLPGDFPAYCVIQ